LAQLPHEVADFCQSRFGLGQTCFSVIKPLVKAGVECLAQAVPLLSCTHLG
jgi:hypothetical protein